SFFLVGYTLAFAAALVASHLLRLAIAAVLLLLYLAYLYRALRHGDLAEDESLDDLHAGLLIEGGLQRVGYDPRDHSGDPHFVLVAVQTLIALALIVGGARLFVTEVEWLSATALGLPTAVVALVVAPVATELPETFNSVLWIARDKDTLALNNVTGAMAFQGTLPVTLGIVFTSWDLNLHWGTAGFLNAVSVVLAIVSATIVLYRAGNTEDHPLEPSPFLVGGAFYVLFIALAAYFVLGVGSAV
ncbi:MAG: sodium:calcium antiporter, partial [Salinigranum sp.]